MSNLFPTVAMSNNETQIIMTREEAVTVTQRTITDMTFEQAKQICEDETKGFDPLSRASAHAWNIGVGGWYYNVENNTFCTDMIIRGTLLTYLGGLQRG
jgi:hypothetical protein